MAIGALAPLVGPLADLFGRKTLLVVGLVGSIVGSIVYATIPTAEGSITG
jgi:MFS family permease